LLKGYSAVRFLGPWLVFPVLTLVKLDCTRRVGPYGSRFM
jgi:hypothetical protein